MAMTLLPCRAYSLASIAAIVVLPTPPLPATAIFIAYFLTKTMPWLMRFASFRVTPVRTILCPRMSVKTVSSPLMMVARNVPHDLLDRTVLLQKDRGLAHGHAIAGRILKLVGEATSGPSGIRVWHPVFTRWGTYCQNDSGRHRKMTEIEGI